MIFPSDFIAPARAVHIVTPMSVVNAPNMLSIRASVNVKLCRTKPLLRWGRQGEADEYLHWAAEQRT